MNTDDSLKRSIAALDASRARILGTGSAAVVTHAAAVRMVAAWTLVPAPRDPVEHLQAAHARARRHLIRLTKHDAAREVVSPMTNELFDRLTDAHPAPLTAAAGVGRYTYTPRKVLRRVLDHALDHVNQIDQWRAWRRDGTVPTPTDGWVPSTETLPDDRLPLAPSDLGAWLWRIDQAAHVLARQAAGLSHDELDWLPPDGGWPLRRVLHHVARSEHLYSASLDEALPADDVAARYAEASRRMTAAADETRHAPTDDSVIYPGLYGVVRTPAEVIDDVLTMERELTPP